MMKIIFTLIVLFTSLPFWGQDSTWQKAPLISFNGFIDTYYAFDFNQPDNHVRQDFQYHHNRHNEFNINLALAQVNVAHEKYKVNIGFHAGTYANDNYASEPLTLKHIYEANIGLSLNKSNTLWLDAGIFPSHLGFESAISIDNPTLTRSLVADGSPYFLSGAKLNWKKNTWNLNATICNGWQRIERIPGNTFPSFGTQISYETSNESTINWSTFVGTEDPDTTRRMFYFNNLYGTFNLSEKLYLITGVDFGLIQQSKGSSDYNYWYGPVVILQTKLNKQCSIAFRGEYFDDEKGFIVYTGTTNGFKTMGTSINVDYKPVQNVALRLEGRWFNSKDRIFIASNNVIYNNAFVIGSVAIKFKK